MATNDYLRNLRAGREGSLGGKLWQRSYYGHIVRNGREAEIIREYIRTNLLH
jgi:REP element-mobilizing transposase RayT